MTFFLFVDPNRRPQAKIRKMTEELTQKFQAIDPDLTLIHNDNFIDYGPEVFPKLSKIYWDPRVPDHPMEHFVYSEYLLRYRVYPLYWFTPYDEQIYEYYRKPSGASDSSRQAVKVIDQAILKVIHEYQVHNLFYWNDLFSEKQLEQERLKPYNRPSQFIGPGELVSSPISFTDPKHRPLAAVEKNTEYLETQLNKLDLRLSLIHDDSYIDFGPKIGRFLAEYSYDPEEDEPDDPIRDLSDSEYQIYYGDSILYSFTPYTFGTGYQGNILSGGIPSFVHLGLSDELDATVIKHVHKYQLNNLYYWRDYYTTGEFQKEIKKYKKIWCLE
ncbi:hypothetical protein [Enterococcus mundtii]|uniref:Uncharacterized protein n=1 Tax=Enterococcus mundtii TaxID=53346 RepID=A0A2T5DCB4_ENTMU|nr:hypothetical protein [Enterococcus mundtii]PTO35389.1 hypothetical protein C6N14_07895 [Enterococcus mundtii]